MGAKRCSLVICVLLVSSLSAWAGEVVEASYEASKPASLRGVESEAQSLALNNVKPWIHPSMPKPSREKLDTAFDIALQRINEIPQCSDLFTELGADAFETLRTGLYFPATPARETAACRRSFAQTFVGAAPTWICRRITSYSDEKAAMVVIHEALHHAGLTERPHDRKAMSSGQINTMVEKACGL